MVPDARARLDAAAARFASISPARIVPPARAAASEGRRSDADGCRRGDDARRDWRRIPHVTRNAIRDDSNRHTRMVYVQKIDLNTERETRARQREIILARGRRDLSTQLTTRLDCGEYNLGTRSRGTSNGSRGTSNGSRGVRTLDAS